MNNKKIVSMIALALATIMMLTACGSSGSNSSSASGSTKQSSSAAQPSSTAQPSSSAAASSEAEVVNTASGVDGKGATITIGIQGCYFVTDFEDNDLTRKVEKDMNINIDFVVLPEKGADIRTKLSLMASGGDELPDIVIVDVLSDAAVFNYGINGIFIPLNEYIENESISPNWYAVPEFAREEMLTAMTYPDGNIYGLAVYNKETWNLTNQRLWINGAWLEKLNLEVPTTTDELYEVVKAFVEKDPNGNGKADEIGINGSFSGYGRNTIYALMNCFIYYSNILELAEDGETVMSPVTQDAWREGIAFMRKLCEEGLLDSTIFTQDESQTRAIMNAETPVVGFTASGANTYFVNSQSGSEMIMIPPLTGPDGVCYSPYYSYTPLVTFFVTSSAKDPELCYRLGEYFYEDSMSLNSRLGYTEDSPDWTRDPEVTSKYTSVGVLLGISEGVEIATDLNKKGDPAVAANNTTWGATIMPKYMKVDQSYYQGNILKGSEEEAQAIANLDSMASQMGVLNLVHYADKHPEKTLPALKYTEDELTTLGEIQTNVKEYVKTALAEFITGERPLNDSEWEKYLKELDSLGLGTWIENAQTSYDRTK